MSEVIDMVAVWLFMSIAYVDNHPFILVFPGALLVIVLACILWNLIRSTHPSTHHS